jgi:multiple sugar transport system permease protein
MRTDRTFVNFFRYLLLISVSLVILAPFLWMVTTSFKSFSKVLIFPPQWIPNPFVWQNYVELFVKQPFHLYFFNSLYIAVLVTAGTCLFGAMAGYAFAKIHFPYKNIIFIALLSSMMIPTEITTIPMFVLLSESGLVNTHFPLIVPPMLGAGGMLGVFLCRQFYITIPKELDEAAKIDGCSLLRTFVSIMLPLSGPALSTLSIITLLHSWNEFFEPLVYLSSSHLFTIPLALSLFATDSGTEWHLIMAAAVVSTIPLLLLFFIAQKRFIEGVTMTGLK